MTWMVGDIQGCFEEFILLRDATRPTSSSPLILLGDTVNRGPLSVEMVRYLIDAGPEIQAIIGNHELHVARQILNPGREQSASCHWIDELDSGEKERWFEQILTWPLYREGPDFIAVHGGLPPRWTLSDFRQRCLQASMALAEAPDEVLLGSGSQFNEARETLQWVTNLRYVTEDGSPVFGPKMNPANAEAGHLPWFRHVSIQNSGKSLYYGHWASLGLHREENTLCLDSGCVWGGRLSSWNHEQGRLVTVPSNQPGKRFP